MKLTKNQKRYLRENFRFTSDAVLAEEMGVSEEFVRHAFKQLQLKRTEAELNKLQVQEMKKKSVKSRFAGDKKFLVPKPLWLYLTGALLILIVLFFILTKLLPTKNKYISDLNKLIKPLQASEMNILFVTLDTTRADHLGCYGYDQVETPNMDKLAETGILFKNAICQIPLTLPSHSSIFTGTYPFYHGVRDNGGFYLEPENVTLAEVLKDHGMITSAFVSAFVLDSRWGLDQGIDYYYDNFDFAKYKRITLDSVQREGGEVITAFFDWFEKNYQERFFSWIHLYDPHTPYEPPEPYKTEYSTRPWGLYDGEIAYVDSLIGRVLDKLREKEVLKKTLVVIVGDHGESLGEHEESTHGFFIYDATIAIPLIIHLPSSKLGGKIVDEYVETIDIMPTLLQILGLPLHERIQGESLLPLMMGKNPNQGGFAYSETYYPRYHFGWSELKSLQDSRYKYILAPKPELYDLMNDPAEQSNIYNQDINIGKKFEQEIKSLQEKLSAEGIEEKGPQKLDEESTEKLMALGYIGGFTSRSKLNESNNLSDPKDKIHLFQKIKMAEGDSAEGNLKKALENLTEVIEEDPRIMEARLVRARIYLKTNQPEKALADSKAALNIDPEYESAIYTLAQAYKLQKKYDEAIAGYERLMQLDPRDHKPVHNLGEVYLEMKDLDRSIAYLEQAIDMEPQMSAMSHNLLGLAYFEKKLLNQAEEELKKALALRPQIPDAHYNLALVYEERNELRKAVEEYKKEIELHPAAYPAHFNLAKVYGKTGNLRAGIEHFEAAIKYKKDFANGYLFLAKAYLDLGENFDEAINLAKKALELAPESEYAPLGHYVLADIYNRLGQKTKYLDELRKGQQLQRKLDKNN